MSSHNESRAMALPEILMRTISIENLRPRFFLCSCITPTKPLICTASPLVSKLMGKGDESLGL